MAGLTADTGGNPYLEGEQNENCAIGATGNVGTRLISELRRRGHQVTAIARHPEKLDRQDGVNPAVGDVQNENALAAVLAGHDVAIHSVKFLSTDPAKVIAATKAAKVPRLLVVGGAGSLEERRVGVGITNPSGEGSSATAAHSVTKGPSCTSVAATG